MAGNILQITVSKQIKPCNINFDIVNFDNYRSMSNAVLWGEEYQLEIGVCSGAGWKSTKDSGGHLAA